MSTDHPKLTYSPKEIGKIIRHAGAVYPLEAYGFLVGDLESTTIVSALPVSKTCRWYDFSDRFASIDSALPIAKTVAESFGLDVLGVYHSFYDFRGDSPIHDVPERFSQGVVCIKEPLQNPFRFPQSPKTLIENR